MMAGATAACGRPASWISCSLLLIFLAASSSVVYINSGRFAINSAFGIISSFRNPSNMSSFGPEMSQSAHGVNSVACQPKHNISQSNETAQDAVMSETPCSFDVNREFSKQCDYFPSGGEWVNLARGEGKHSVPHFRPQLCRFLWPNIQPDFLKSSLRAANITSVVVLGDSQGSRYSTALYGHLQRAMPKQCKITKRENLKGGFIPDKSYMAQGDQVISTAMSVFPRHCRGCSSFRSVCTNGNHNIVLEYLGMTDLVDGTVRLYKNPKPDGDMETYQEFLFHHYFVPHPPDVIIVCVPLNHAKFRSNPAKFVSDLRYLRSMIRNYMPACTRVIWLPGMREHEAAKSRNPLYKNKRVDGMLAWEAIDRLNHVMYNQLKTWGFLEPAAMDYSFLDLIQMSESRASWALSDGVHMKPIWYQRVTSHLLELICRFQ